MLQLNFSPFPTLATERLILKKITHDDAAEIFYQRSDPGIMKYVDRPPAQTLEDAHAFIDMITKNLDDNNSISWGIQLKGSDRLIGNIALWRIEKENHRAEIGYCLHPAEQGKGYMNETLRAVAHYGFGTMRLHSIEANINPENLASQKALERIGFVREAYFTENYYYDGRYIDSAIYSLLTPHR